MKEIAYSIGFQVQSHAWCAEMAAPRRWIQQLCPVRHYLPPISAPMPTSSFTTAIAASARLRSANSLGGIAKISLLISRCMIHRCRSAGPISRMSGSCRKCASLIQMATDIGDQKHCGISRAACGDSGGHCHYLTFQEVWSSGVHSIAGSRKIGTD